jgi:putative membrane protein
MKRRAIVLGTALAFTAVSAGAQPSSPPSPPIAESENPLIATVYLARAFSADQFEIDSGLLAQQKSSNQQVRNFANLLVADHTRTAQMLTAMADFAGLTPPPPGLRPEQQAMLGRLQAAAPGMSFDIAFKNAQIAAHRTTLLLHQLYAGSGDVPALRNIASQAVPMMRMHLNQAQMLNVVPPAQSPQPSTPPLPSTQPPAP